MEIATEFGLGDECDLRDSAEHKALYVARDFAKSSQFEECQRGLMIANDDVIVIFARELVMIII